MPVIRTTYKLILIILMMLFFIDNTASQNIIPEKKNRGIDKSLSESVLNKNINPEEQKGYISYLKNLKSAESLIRSVSSPDNHPVNQPSEQVIFLEPNKPMSIGCPNMGFDLQNFTNWTGSSGTVSAGSSGANPNYNVVSNTIVNSAGLNVSVLNPLNFHTIMSIPAINPIYPSCVGYDSLACTVVNTQTISEVPFVSPYSFDNVSVRLNSANANNRAARLKYITTSSSINKRLSYSFAVVFQDPTSTPHLPQEAPYFSVVVKNEITGQIIQGCSSDSFNPLTSLPSDSIKNSIINYNDPVQYRKWALYNVDLSYLPSGTPVSVTFEVGGCTKSGHWGYAYVDAECGGTASPYCNMCSGSSTALLVAPEGFIGYQWIDPSGNTIPSANNDTLIVNSAIVGQTYSVNLLSSSGCSLTQTVSISQSNVYIIDLNTTSSCAGGNSGTASIIAGGSNSSYTYSWTATSGSSSGQIVSYNQTATNLSPGTYSVVVSSNGCGQASGNLSIGTSPPTFLTINKSFCSDVIYLAEPNGSNYQWYIGSGSSSTVIPGTKGNNDSLEINNPKNGDIYTLAYITSNGCRDSIRYILNESNQFGMVNISALENPCVNSQNGTVNFTLKNPISSGPYNYSFSGNGINTSGTLNSTSFDFNNLSAGTYSLKIFDGYCNYNKDVTLVSQNLNFLASSSNSVLCNLNDTVTVNLNYLKNNCNTESDLCFSNNQLLLFSAGTFTSNSYNNYPTVFGNYYTYGRTQFLVRKSDLNNAGISEGKLSSISFNVLDYNYGKKYYSNFFIKIGCTTLTAMPDASTASQNFISNTTTVYSKTNQPVSLGWNTFDFQNSYNWDNNSNLIVEICFDMNEDYDYTENLSIQLKQMPYITNMYRMSDTDPICGSNLLATNSSGSFMSNGKFMLPNMKFEYCATQSLTDYTISSSPNANIISNFNNDSIKIVNNTPVTPGSSIVYTISVSTPTNNCVSSNTVAILYPSQTVTVSTSVNNPTVCIGSNLNIYAYGPQYFNWFEEINGSLVPINIGSSLTVTPMSSGLHNYVVTGSSDCFSSSDTKTVTVNVIPKATLSINGLNDFSKCLNTDAVISSSITTTNPNIATNYTYTWTTLPGNTPAPGTNSLSSYTVSSNSTTTLVLNVDGFCANPTSNTITVANYPNNLVVSIIDSVFGCASTPFTLNAAVSGGRPNYSYNWFIVPDINSIGSYSVLSYNFPEQEGTYTISVVANDSCGYASNDNQLITVLPPCTLIIPNIITPNSDGANETFKIKNLEFFPNTTLTIFDRWGRKIYEKSNYDNSWKADGVLDGTYFYTLIVPNDKTYTGFITVLTQK